MELWLTKRVCSSSVQTDARMNTMSVVRSQPLPAATLSIPLLANGDQLTRREFERRYVAMPAVNKAELIEGTVYMPSPVRFEQHGRPHSLLAGWLVYYVSRTPGLTGIGDNSTVRLDEDNEPQPDLILMMPADRGGHAMVDSDGYITGAPELVCEISASTVSIDLHDKLNAYRRNGVREYIVWRTEEGAIDWFILREGRYQPLQIEEGGLLKSEAFPGLWLNCDAILQSDLPRLLQSVDAGTSTPEHAAFVGRLSTAPK